MVPRFMMEFLFTYHDLTNLCFILQLILDNNILYIIYRTMIFKKLLLRLDMNKHIGCIVSYASTSGTCQVFSLPFIGDFLTSVGNIFPSIVFRYVKKLVLFDIVPFEHEFFLRIARFFPSLTELDVFNLTPQLHSSDVFDSNGNQLYPIVEYLHLTSLMLIGCHTDYIEQFLNNTKIHLPRLTRLQINYNQLRFVTEDFTRDATRFNCAQVKQLIIYRTLVRSKDFCTYFPLL
jgi:hypothetical protein